VKGAVLRTGRNVDTSPPTWELLNANETSAFTQVNFRCVNKIRFRWVTAISNNDVYLRQVAPAYRSRKRVEAQDLAVN